MPLSAVLRGKGHRWPGFACWCESRGSQKGGLRWEAYLWPDEIDVLVCAENAAVITDVAMAASHTKINQHIFTDGIADDLSKDFPAVEEGITWRAVSPCLSL